ncbi:CPBP family intramembrane glutamic endopeptidase [Sporosarcina cascadiensis]|uniref:CPBP family intramembrane glutamic endopeptidase n=1 Tax=Sporosarcina cascadiensis TaxID=2660747 RepID=UPI00129B4162|nr:CPBP family intramembrane glutamic endopeptidase [Sporosarcina cascadiensis]
MDSTKDKSNNSKHEFKLKETVFAFSSFAFICLAVIFAFIVYDVFTIQNFLSFDKPAELLIISGISSVALLLFGLILTLIIPANYIDDNNKTYQDDSLPAIFIFMFAAALFEELLFRGIIQNLLFLFMGYQWFAILLTALLFTVFHVQYFKKPIMLLNICIPILVFGWIYFKTGNILVPVFVHFVMNFGMTVLFKYKLLNLRS